MRFSSGLRVSVLVGVLFAGSVAMAQQHMAFAPQNERPRTIFDAIFGTQKRPAPVYNDFSPPSPPMGLSNRGTSSRPTPPSNPATGGSAAKPNSGQALAGGMSRRSGGGGSLAVCVRTCDGFFFPVNYEGARGADKFAEACQSSCPNAETEVFFKSPSADMDAAANAKGRNYTQLPNAFKYRTQRDAACTCKSEDQTWAQALKGAEELMGTRKSDIIVTQERSDQLVRPADSAVSTRSKDRLASVGAGVPKAE